MSENQEHIPPPEQLPPKKRRSWKRVGFWLLVFLLFLSLPYYYFGRAKDTITPWSWSRENPKNVSVKVKNTSLGLSANVGAFLSRIGASTASGTSHRSNSCTDFSVIVVRPGSNHPLAIACAKQIAGKLKEIPEIQRIEFTAFEPLTDKSRPLPEYIVQVDDISVNEWFLPNRSMTATLGVSFGRRFVQFPCVYAGADDAPLFEFNSNSTLQIQCSHTGTATQAYFYDRIGQDIAKNVHQSIKKVIDDANQKFPPLPELPDAFYPPYQAASETPQIPGVVSRTMLCEGRRLMMPHYSMEKIEIESDKPSTEYLTELQNQMNEDGWTGKLETSPGNAPPYLRLTKGLESYYLFQNARTGFVLSFETLMNDALQNEDKKAKTPEPTQQIFYLERTAKMDHASVLKAIEVLLEERASPQTPLIFTSLLHGNEPIFEELKQKMYGAIKDSKPDTTAALLAAAEFYEQFGKKEEAKATLFLAWRTRQLTMQQESDATYKNLAKKLDVLEEMESLPPPTPELCEEVGFSCVTPEMCPYEITTDPNREVRIAAVSPTGGMTICFVKVRTQGMQLLPSYSSKTIEEHGSSSSSMESTGGDFVGFGFHVNGTPGQYSVGLAPGQTPYREGPVTTKVQHFPGR